MGQAASDAEFVRLLSSPDDPVLNRQFAASAEARGELRHALAALERARAARPDDADLRAEYERIRRKMLPSVTTVTVQLGGSYASNSRQTPSGSPRKREDGLADAAISVEDERTMAGVRMRSRVIAAGQWHNETSELSSGRVSAETGPVMMLSAESWLHIAPGVSVVWLDEQQLYSEASAQATVGTVWGGLSQSVTFRYGWRNGEADAGYANAHVIDVLGRLVFNPQVVKGDYLYVQPGYRYSDAVDGAPETVVLPTVLGPDTLVSRDISPYTFHQWGGRLSYMFPIMAGRIFLGAGISVHERRFESNVLDADALAQGVPVATDEKRRDVYIEPTAHVVFPSLLGPSIDVRADYRLEDNHSNDSSREFHNHVVGMRVIGRF